MGQMGSHGNPLSLTMLSPLRPHGYASHTQKKVALSLEIRVYLVASCFKGVNCVSRFFVSFFPNCFQAAHRSTPEPSGSPVSNSIIPPPDDDALNLFLGQEYLSFFGQLRLPYS